MSEVNPERQYNRKFIRVDTRVECEFQYMRAAREITSKGMILDISGGGLKLMSSDHVATGNVIVVKTNFSDGPIELCGKVVNSSLDWYINDDGKKTFWSTGVQFEGLTPLARSRVISYVHKRMSDVREARLFKNRSNP